MSSLSSVSEATKDEYRSALGETLLGIDPDKSSSRILSFKDKAPTPRGDTINNLNILYSATAGSSSRVKSSSSKQLISRQIPSAPSRILDAPDLLDDYYLNLLSWSDTNILAVALSQTVYLWNAGTGDIQELCSVEGDNRRSHFLRLVGARRRYTFGCRYIARYYAAMGRSCIQASTIHGRPYGTCRCSCLEQAHSLDW